MTQRFGDRATFAVEVGAIEPPQLRVVDLWAAGKRLTTYDNTAYVPFLTRAMRSTAARVRQRDVAPCPFPGHSPEAIFRLLSADETEFREQFSFIQWGEIVDNILCYAYLDHDLVIVLAFRRSHRPFSADPGQVFVTRLGPDKFVATLEDAADLIDLESSI